MKKKIVMGVSSLLIISVAILFIPMGNTEIEEKKKPLTVEIINMSEYSDKAPQNPLRLLFIHHSCGGQLLAPAGEEEGENCIYKRHENGGGLREKLERNRYEVHEASYHSEVGDKTDIFDWPPKFSRHMDKVLTCDHQDRFYTDGIRNNIVVFKSCFPNNNFKGEGISPGNPAGPELTVWNAKAAYASLLGNFSKHPDVLFVAVTAPPLANYLYPEPLWKTAARRLLKKRSEPSGPLARKFNNWLKSKDGWLKGYPHSNVAVFDYYDILTKGGQSDYSAYSTGNGTDSHPSREGNTVAADMFIPFINRAVRRAGLSD